MGLDRRKALYGAAVAVRLLLFAIPGLPDYLGSRIELSTPITSFKRLQEGLFLYTHSVSPYDGGVYHQAPLLLPLFASLPSLQTWPIATNLCFILADLAAGEALRRIARSGAARRTGFYVSPRHTHEQDDLQIAAGYLLNPITIASCAARSTIVFTACSILTAISKAVQGQLAPAMLALAMASYLSVYPALLLPSMILLCLACQPLPQLSSDPIPQEPPTSASPRLAEASDQRKPRDQAGQAKSHLTTSRSALRTAAKCLFSYLAALWALLLTSYLLSGQSWHFISSVYGVHVLLPDLTPNVGLWWYFFIEIFDAFRNFFLGVFWLHLSSYSVGLSIRIHLQPLAVLVALIGLSAIFKPYPSAGDAAFFLAMLPLHSHVFPLRRYTFVGYSVLAYSAFLGPAFYYLWIYAGSGNANFFYAITLVWSLGLSMLITDFVYATLRDEWELQRPEMKGKEARQT